MKEIIPINESQGQRLVSARNLYDFLDVKSDFTHWIRRMIKYGFDEGEDYTYTTLESTGGRPAIDFALTLDTAKEISMLQRNDRGKEARRYFIEVEKESRREYQRKLVPKSPAELALYQAQLLVAQEKKLAEHDERIKKLEAKTTTRPEYFTIAGYGSLNGISVNLKIASSLGRKAASICKERGIQMDEIPDPRFGRVKMYPAEILEEVFEMRVNC